MLHSGIKGCLLIVLRPTAGQLDPEALVASYFDKLDADQLARPRYIIRLTPLSLTLCARLPDAMNALPTLLQPHFGVERPPTRWQIVFKKRATSPEVTAREWVPALAGLVDARHPGKRSYFLVFVPTVREIRYFYRARCNALIEKVSPCISRPSQS
eukprot:SAG31_NODE_2319_length_5944_cov_9.686056_1_plen_156_part_00